MPSADAEQSQLWCPKGNLDCHCVTTGRCVGIVPLYWPSSPTAHEKRLRQMHCLISGSSRITLHHCRGGSMHETPWNEIGIGLKQSEALQIPLHWDWHVGEHRIDGPLGYSVKDWEQLWKPQTELLWQLSRNLGFNLWALAWEWATYKERELLKRKFSPALLSRLGL